MSFLNWFGCGNDVPHDAVKALRRQRNVALQEVDRAMEAVISIYHAMLRALLDSERFDEWISFSTKLPRLEQLKAHFRRVLNGKLSLDGFYKKEACSHHLFWCELCKGCKAWPATELPREITGSLKTDLVPAFFPEGEIGFLLTDCRGRVLQISADLVRCNKIPAGEYAALQRLFKRIAVEAGADQYAAGRAVMMLTLGEADPA